MSDDTLVETVDDVRLWRNDPVRTLRIYKGRECGRNDHTKSRKPKGGVVMVAEVLVVSRDGEGEEHRDATSVSFHDDYCLTKKSVKEAVAKLVEGREVVKVMVFFEMS